MTPKEKALELGNKMYNGSVFSKTIKEHLDELKNAKRCALIAIDEIIDLDFNIKCDASERCVSHIIEFYENVKQEIEKL